MERMSDDRSPIERICDELRGECEYGHAFGKDYSMFHECGPDHCGDNTNYQCRELSSLIRMVAVRDNAKTN